MYINTHQCLGGMLMMDVCWCLLRARMYVDAYRWSACMSMITNVLDVCQWSPMSWMYADANQWPGCISMLIDGLDVCHCLLMLIDGVDVFRWSPMSWMYTDAHQWLRCISMLTDGLDVGWCLLMTWMCNDVHCWPPDFDSRCTLMSFDFYLLYCSEKNPFLTTRYPPPKVENSTFLRLSLKSRGPLREKFLPSLKGGRGFKIHKFWLFTF